MKTHFYCVTFYEDCQPHYFKSMAAAKAYAEREVGHEIPWQHTIYDNEVYGDICYIDKIYFEG